MTERVYVIPPGSQIGPITPEERKGLLASSLVAGVYEKLVDRESAFEKLKGRAAGTGETAQSMRDEAEATFRTGGAKAGSPAAPAEASGGLLGGLGDILFGSTGPRGGKKPGVIDAAATSAARSIGSSVGREIVRGVLGGLLGGGKRRR